MVGLYLICQFLEPVMDFQILVIVLVLMEQVNHLLILIHLIFYLFLKFLIFLVLRDLIENQMIHFGLLEVACQMVLLVVGRWKWLRVVIFVQVLLELLFWELVR